jgi:hypothetical protein
LTGGGSTLGIKTIPMPAHDAAEIETPIRDGSGGECQPRCLTRRRSRLVSFSTRFLITRTLQRAIGYNFKRAYARTRQ